MKRVTWISFLVCFAMGSAFSIDSFALERQVTVTGSCTHEISTDRAAVIVTAQAQEADIKSAVKEATRSYDNALSAIQRLDLPEVEMKTVEYTVMEVKEWENNKNVSKGFRARIGLKVSTSAAERLGDVMEIAARENMEAGSLDTYLSTEKLHKEQDLCLKDAAENARSKALKLASTLGAKLGEVITLTENNAAPPHPVVTPLVSRSMLRASSEETAPEVQAGQQEVTAFVQASFALR